MNTEILLKAIETYGKKNQKIMLFEEMAELQKEVCKSLRGNNNKTAIIEEIADVLIMIEQLKMMEKISDSVINLEIRYKTERLRKRLENQKGEDYDERIKTMPVLRRQSESN